MRLYQMADAVRYEMMNTEELRETFLLEGLFQPGEIEFAYVDLDRTVIGPPCPSAKSSSSKPSPNSVPNTSSSAANWASSTSAAPAPS